MTFLKVIWKWLKKYPWAFIVVFGSATGALFLLASKANQISSFDDAVQVRAAAREIVRKEARVKELLGQENVNIVEMVALKSEIAASKKRIMEIYNATSLENESDDDIARLFTAAGF